MLDARIWLVINHQDIVLNKEKETKIVVFVFLSIGIE
jgi:hypothetical protein